MSAREAPSRCPKCDAPFWLCAAEVETFGEHICLSPAPTINAPQPPPTSDDAGPEVWPALLAEVALSPELRALCEERDAMGRAKYGTALRVHNGREPLVDALQESLDLAVYLQQAMMQSRDARSRYRLMRDDALSIARALLEEVTP